ncbi:hypothetical protein RFI_39617, partial [Reticulomyxa filosa]
EEEEEEEEEERKIQKQGFVKKKGEIRGDIWKERYVELWTDGNWCEYNEKGILLNVIDISLSQHICALCDCQFSIVMPGRVFSFVANTQSERDHWIACLHLHLQFYSNENDNDNDNDNNEYEYPIEAAVYMELKENKEGCWDDLREQVEDMAVLELIEFNTENEKKYGIRIVAIQYWWNINAPVFDINGAIEMTKEFFARGCFGSIVIRSHLSLHLMHKQQWIPYLVIMRTQNVLECYANVNHIDPVVTFDFNQLIQ